MYTFLSVDDDDNERSKGVIFMQTVMFLQQRLLARRMWRAVLIEAQALLDFDWCQEGKREASEKPPSSDEFCITKETKQRKWVRGTGPKRRRRRYPDMKFLSLTEAATLKLS